MSTCVIPLRKEEDERRAYMRKDFYMNRFRNLAIASAAVVMMTACRSQYNNLSYFTDIPAEAIASIAAATTDYSLKILPDDELSITVSSLAPEATAMYNLPMANIATRGTTQATANLGIQTYIVDTEGNINFPILGTIHVAGLSTQELSDLLVDMISKDVDTPIVRVQILNFAVNVLGEVRAPGRQPINKEMYSILDALAVAGDMTEFGRRDNILLIRQQGDTLVYHRFNLNDARSLNSPYYYLKQNDVVYVEPTKVRADNSRYNTFNSYKLTVISTVVSAASVIASLTIALTR